MKCFSGNGHTTNPETWINRFKEKNYNIFSYILKASKETCLHRTIKHIQDEIFPARVFRKRKI